VRITISLVRLLAVSRGRLSVVRVIQNGDMRIYLLYIIAALCILLVLI
jgi:hypothetical protein